jgi:superfamily II DNA or RNA helicase
MTRCFTPAQRVALYLRSSGHCAICSRLLNPANWHADHRIPFAHGGPTEMWNGQALCPPCNLLKSMDFDLSGVVPSGLELRPWQLQFLTRTDRRADGEYLGFLRHATVQATTPSDQERKAYVLNAFPGTGKTKAAFTGAKYLLMHNVVDTVIYLVPSDNLRKSAADESELFQMPLAVAKRSAQFDFAFEKGVVISYHQVGIPAYRNLIQHYCETRRVLVIADEMHHLGDNMTWGDAYGKTFAKATVKLMTTGTPFRSDGIAIPGVEYRDRPGKNMVEVVCHMSYDYGKALADKAVRPVDFQPWTGSVGWRSRRDGQEYTHAIDEALRQTYPAPDHELQFVRSLEADRRWHVFDTPRDTDKAEYLLTQLAKADEVLRSLRATTHPWAGGLIVARDTAHADEIARMLEELTGQEPAVIHGSIAGGQKAAGDKLSRYKGKPEYGYNRSLERPRWLVSVGMVKEGVDIPFLRVLVWATNIDAPLSFYQIIGRVLRKEQGVEFQDAMVFIPQEPNWWLLAETMREAVAEYRIKIGGGGGGGGGGGTRPDREGLGTEGAANGGLLHDGTGTHAMNEAERQKAERWALRFGMSSSQINQMWQRGGDTEEARQETWNEFVEYMSTQGGN